MSRDRIAKVITIALLVSALVFLVARREGVRAPPRAKHTPEDTIYSMLDAAKAGDANAYLSQYTGPMHANLKQVAVEKGADGFAQYLRSTSAELKGLAVSEAAAPTEDQAQLRVEYVYQDRNETQLAYLERVSGEWKIARVDGSEQIKTLVPYGTPVQ